MTGFAFRTAKLQGLGLLLLLASLSGCFNDGQNVTDLGSVSLGQQLIDLKRARDEGAINEDEYQKAKADMLTFMSRSGDSDHD